MDIEQPEALQDHSDRERCFVHGKATSNAGALAVSERLPGIDGARGLRLAAEIFRIERIGVRAPYCGIAMQRQHQHSNERVLLQAVFAADRLVLRWRNAVGGRGRPQPQ